MPATTFDPGMIEPRIVSDIHSTRILSLDSNGRILDWISWQDTVCLYVRDAVSWTLGSPCLTIHGGSSRLTGEQSTLDLHPIEESIAEDEQIHLQAMTRVDEVERRSLAHRGAGSIEPDIELRASSVERSPCMRPVLIRLVF